MTLSPAILTNFDFLRRFPPSLVLIQGTGGTIIGTSCAPNSSSECLSAENSLKSAGRGLISSNCFIFFLLKEYWSCETATTT